MMTRRQGMLSLLVDIIWAGLCLIVSSMKAWGRGQLVLVRFVCLFFVFEVWNMTGGFRLRISLWGSFVFVWCIFFNQECCVFIQYNLLKGCCKWILIQPWTQVIDYSLPGLTWHTRLRIGISHLSISGIVVHGRCYISHCFYFSVLCYDCLLVDICFLFLFSCLSTVVLSTKNPY